MEDIETDKTEPKDHQQDKPTFFEELKRRKVFRVAITYAVVSWLIIQIAATTFGNFGIPVWAFRFVVLMVLLGFPVAIVLTWAFELTPDGVKKTATAKKMPQSTDPDTLNRKRNWYAIGMAAALPTLIFGTLALFFYLGRSPESAQDPTQISTETDGTYSIGQVAVLPFTLFSEDNTLRTTADGLQDEMLTVLSEMKPLDVVSRTSTLQFSDTSQGIPEIGRILGADYIVEGSLQPYGEKLRVTLQLIHAEDDKHVWAETFDRAPELWDEPLVFQKELAFELGIRIYQALKKAVPPQGSAATAREQKISELETRLESDYATFWVSWRRDGWADLHASILNRIEDILIIDPDNFIAHECLSGAMSATIDVGIRDISDPEWHKEYYLILKRAYVVAPDGFDTNKHLAIYYNGYKNLPSEAIPFAYRAVELDLDLRGFVDIYTYWTLLEALCATGQGAAAVRIMEEATEEGLTNFSGPTWFWTRGYQIMRQPKKQIDFLEKELARVEETDFYAAIASYRFQLAMAQAYWTGSNSPIDEFLESVDGKKNVFPDFLAAAAFQTRNFQRMLDVFSEIIEGSSWTVMEVDMAGARAWAYLKTGNLPLARSYFRGFLDGLESSEKGKWMKVHQPDWHLALQAYGNACLGNREIALDLIERALAKTNPSRHFRDYFQTVRQLAVTHAILGDDEQASGFIDLMLSSPSGFSTGQILVDPQFDDLHDSPLFEAVIRKHANQLKDPSILERYFKIVEIIN